MSLCLAARFIAPYAPELRPVTPVVPRPPFGTPKASCRYWGSSAVMKVSNCLPRSPAQSWTQVKGSMAGKTSVASSLARAGSAPPAVTQPLTSPESAPSMNWATFGLPGVSDGRTTTWMSRSIDGEYTAQFSAPVSAKGAQPGGGPGAGSSARALGATARDAAMPAALTIPTARARCALGRRWRPT